MLLRFVTTLRTYRLRVGRHHRRAIVSTDFPAGSDHRCRVANIGRNQKGLDRAIAVGDADGGVMGDVTSQSAVEAAIEAAGAACPIDVLVSNAGAAGTAPYRRTDADMILGMFDVNLLGCSRFEQILGTFVADSGRGGIVAVATIPGSNGTEYVSAYVAAKQAVVGYVRAVATELASTGVTINAACPGFTDTDKVAASLEKIVGKTGRSREEEPVPAVPDGAPGAALSLLPVIAPPRVIAPLFAPLSAEGIVDDPPFALLPCAGPARVVPCCAKAAVVAVRRIAADAAAMMVVFMFLSCCRSL